MYVICDGEKYVDPALVCSAWYDAGAGVVTLQDASGNQSVIVVSDAAHAQNVIAAIKGPELSLPTA
jgi:urocanate hydratase